MKLSPESLYKDHDNLRRVLYLLEQLLIDICRGSSIDYSMFNRILTYIQDYPERVHHPTEDAMFSVILKKGITNKEFHRDINMIMRDHSEIESITRDAIEAVDVHLVSAGQNIKGVAGKLSTLVSRQRSHMLFEEMNIYPHMADYLENHDWEKITALIPDNDDPVFGDKVSKEYEQIFKAL